MFICTIFALQAWIILKNNHETTYTNWGKKNYKLWLIIIIIIIIIIVNFFITNYNSILYFMYPIFLFVSICFLLIVHLELDKLDQSGNYNFSIYELKKLKSYISLFIILWVRFFFYLNQWKFYDSEREIKFYLIIN